MSETIISIQGDTVDLICWRHYGAGLGGGGVVEKVLEANPGLAGAGEVLDEAGRVVSFGPFLPIGTVVKMPYIPKPADMPTVSLWD